MYETLVKDYQFEKEKVFVLYAGGQELDFDGDGHSEVYGPALKPTLTQLLMELEAAVQDNDLFCFFVTNHGEREPGTGKALAWLWAEQYITGAEIADLLNNLKSQQQVLFFQPCYAGGVMPDLSSSCRVIGTACAHDEVSYARMDLQYDEFLCHFFSTLRGRTPEGYRIPRNETIKAAFQYAQGQNSQNEHPQYSDPSGLGEALTLAGFVGPANQAGGTSLTKGCSEPVNG
jgi:hypothetical protein